MPDLQKVYDAVQQNCHISDGLYAQNYGLCIYLLKMRELYRWEKSLPLTAPLSKEEVGDWLCVREQLWDELADKSFACIPIDDDCYDPFETAAINQVLLPQGIVYGGGYGQFCKPSFFIGRLLKHEWREGLEVLIAADEYVRDLSAPPAMTLGTTIFIRRESVRRALWERIEEWNWKKPENHFAQLLETYHVAQNLETALDKMTDDQIEIIINHEIGEVQAGVLLGDNWEKMLVAIAGSKAEWVARAVRDHLADCLVTLPKLLETGPPTALLFYLANFTGLRQVLFPALVDAFKQWLANENDLEALTVIVKQGQTHWLNTAQSLLAWFIANPDDCATVIANQVESFR